jgi:hypothetical protein
MGRPSRPEPHFPGIVPRVLEGADGIDIFRDIDHGRA